MAGIYFPGMEMPRACVWREDGHLRNCPLYDIDGYCGVIHSEACHNEEERHPDCPAFFVPDHGRMIDVDALPLGENVPTVMMHEGEKWLSAYELVMAPTVIPSDRKEEEA